MDALFQEAGAALDHGDPGAAHRALDRAWMRLAVHIRAEHKVLFPALAGDPGLRGCLSGLREDHDRFMAALARAVTALGASPPDPAPARAALGELLPRLAAHNALEEAEVYPRADAPGSAEALLLAVSLELAALPARYRA